MDMDTKRSFLNDKPLFLHRLSKERLESSMNSCMLLAVDTWVYCIQQMLLYKSLIWRSPLDISDIRLVEAHVILYKDVVLFIH